MNVDAMNAYLVGMILFVVLLVYNKGARVQHDTLEPPLVPASIPILGHMLGLLISGSKYFMFLSEKYKLPLYTLGLPKLKLYVVDSPRLVAAVEKNKDLDFGLLVLHYTRTVLHPSEETVKVLEHNLDGSHGNTGCRLAIRRAFQKSLAPGPHLQQLQLAILDHLSSQILGLQDDNGSTDLFKWTRKTIDLAATDAIYGNRNPFSVTEVMEAFWAIDAGVFALSIDIAPRITAKQAYLARQVLYEAFTEYYRDNDLETASELMRARFNTLVGYDIPTDDIARLETAMPTALLTNTAPACFWALFHIYSDPKLLQDIRTALISLAKPMSSSSQRQSYELKMSSLPTGCPILISTIQEVLRLQATNAAFRGVLRDTVLEDHYLLKKGSFCMMPVRAQHLNQETWGPTAGTFNPRRFLNPDNGQKASKSLLKPPSSGYRPFGGGSALCPGRHLAMSEILYMVTITILNFDIVPEKGEWKKPGQSTHMTSSILPPKEDIKIKAIARQDCHSNVWRFVP